MIAPKRRQSRPFQNVPLSKDAFEFPTPTPALLEHLEKVFDDTDFTELHKQAIISGRPAEVALSIMSEQAGKEKVLGYIRELIMRAREDALDRRPNQEANTDVIR